MFSSLFIFPFALFGGVIGGKEEDQAKLRFFHNSMDNYTELPLFEAKDILSSGWYNSSRTTVIFCHGYRGQPKGPAVTGVVTAYLKQGQSNVALLNWDRLAAAEPNNFVSSYFNRAVPNALELGVDFAEALLRLSTAGLDLNKTHLLGHSLGAHVVGITGNKIVEKGQQLPWITGLDPAGIAFDNKPEILRLNSNSAISVVVIHSDSSKYGSRRELGTVDIWPNHRQRGAVTQPGCNNGPHPRFSLEDLCNHNRCWQLLIDAINNPGTLLASYAPNYKIWKRYAKPERLAHVLEIGKIAKDVLPGNYYLLTTGSSPYGLGENGL